MVYNGRIRRIVGTNVKRIREEKEIAVKDAAEQLGVGRQYWYLIESGGGNLPLDKLEMVALILGVTVHDLLEDVGGKKRRELVKR